MVVSFVDDMVDRGAQSIEQLVSLHNIMFFLLQFDGGWTSIIKNMPRYYKRHNKIKTCHCLEERSSHRGCVPIESLVFIQIHFVQAGCNTWKQHLEIIHSINPCYPPSSAYVDQLLFRYLRPLFSDVFFKILLSLCR